MTERDMQLQACKDYEAALKELRGKCPKNTSYEISSSKNDSSKCKVVYNPHIDQLELYFHEKMLESVIPDEYMEGARAAIDALLSEEASTMPFTTE